MAKSIAKQVVKIEPKKPVVVKKAEPKKVSQPKPKVVVKNNSDSADFSKTGANDNANK